MSSTTDAPGQSRPRVPRRLGFVFWVWLALGIAFGVALLRQRLYVGNMSIVLSLWLTFGAGLLVVGRRRKVYLPIFGAALVLFMTEGTIVILEKTTNFLQPWPPVGSDVGEEQPAFITYDALGRRAVLDPLEPEREFSKHAFFFGGSFTFGHGVRDDEHLPAVFQQLSGGEYKSTNFGQGARGPGLMYTKLDEEEPFSDVELKEGIAVYSFISDHINRTVPFNIHRFFYTYYGWPLFSLDESGELEGPRYVRMKPGLKFFARYYPHIVNFSPLLRTLTRRRNFAFTTERNALEVVARVVIESKKKYEARFSGDFYVILWPRSVHYTRALEGFIVDLEAAGIRVLRVPDMPDVSRATRTPSDPHPSPAEYRWVAEHLYEEIKAKETAVSP